MKWEYKHTTIVFRSNRDLNEKLNELGSDGWETVSIDTVNPNTNGTKTVNVLLKKQVLIEKSEDNKQILND